jgi:hypothetical protein
MQLAPASVGYIELDGHVSAESWSALPAREQTTRCLTLSREREDVSVVVIADVGALRDELDREWLLLFHKAKAMRASSPSRSA